MKLRRNTTTGKIHDDDDSGRPVLLCGGSYHVFEKYNKPGGRGLARPGQNVPFTVGDHGAPPCVHNPKETDCSSPSLSNDLKAKLLKWSPNNNWAQLFTTLRNTKCNLLRVWVMGGTIIYPPQPGVDPNTDPPFDLYPFAPVKSGGAWKWKVYDAVEGVEGGVWNQPFFKRLVDFVDAANASRVCVLLTLFNYFDFTNDGGSSFKSWSRSPWNPTLSVNPPGQPNWGTDHLVNPESNTFSDRNAFFMKPKPPNRLRDVQTAFVRKFVKTLKGKGNVIFEIMNEPRLAPHKDMSRFNSDMVTAINAEAGEGWTPLIAVNASFSQNDKFDTDWWREHSTPGTTDYVSNYDRVDVLTYHGMTGYKNHDRVTGCGTAFSVPPVDPTSMINRLNEHKAEQVSRPEKKSLMFSTDAARIDALEHLYCDVEHPGQLLGMHVRDGQIDTKYLHVNSNPAPQKALKSDLRNWAFWFSKRAAGAANLGLVHFQNHSSFEAAFQKIFTGRQEAATPATAGEISDTPSEETDDTPS
jgi:hypothetical protein